MPLAVALRGGEKQKKNQTKRRRSKSRSYTLLCLAKSWLKAPERESSRKKAASSRILVHYLDTLVEKKSRILVQTSSWKCGAWKLKSPWQVVQRLLNDVTLTYWSCNKEVEGEREETFDPSPISLAEGLFRVIYSHWYANPLCHRQSCWHWRIVDAAFSSSFSFVHLSYKWHENQSCSPSSKSKLPFRTNYNTLYWPSIKRTCFL